ncbi:MAG: hypothetical protein J5I93_28555 [Pirellulaceae bacterium]|nr:hypothetical protein [Pirellulaceae bacterium]
MSDAYRVVARIQDQDDFQAGLTDGYGLRWNDSTSKFELVSFARRDEANTFTGQVHVNYSSSDEALKVTYTGGGAAAIDVSGGMFHMEGGTACLLTTGDFVSYGLGKHGDTDTESIRLGWDSGSSSYQIVTEKTGAGSVRGFRLTAAGMAVLPSAASVVPLTVKGVVSQTANLQEWQNSSGTVLGSFASNGLISLVPTANAGTLFSLVRSGGDNFQQFLIQHENAATNSIYLRLNALAASVPICLIANRTFGEGVFSYNRPPASALSVSGTELVVKSTSIESRIISSSTLYTPLTLAIDTQAALITSPTATTTAVVVKGAASQSANLQEWQNSSGTAGAVITANAQFSNTGGQANSEVFGAGASVSKPGGVAFGRSASCTSAGGTSDGVAIGRLAASTEYAGVAIGGNASAHHSSVAIGQGSVGSGVGGGVALGLGAYGIGRGIAIGSSATTSGNNIAIGFNATTTHDSSIVIGRYSTSTATKQFVVGSDNFNISAIYFGNGVASATPQTVTYNATGGSGTNIAGANINIAGGKGTGSGDGGSIIFQTAPAGISGTTPRSLVNVGQFDTNSTAGNTRFLLYDVDTATLQRVKVGANGTGPSGTGRALYIDNA